MADLAQLESALVKADAAGNVEDARMLAGEIRQMRTTPTAEYEKAPWGDVIAGLPITRLARGAAAPIIAAGQLGANLGDTIVEATGGTPVVGKYINEKLAEYEAAKERGMKAVGNEGYDWMGLIGQLAPSTAIAKSVTAALPAATSLAGRIGTGAAQGAAIAAATPTTSGSDSPLTEKAIQTGVGAVTGGAIPVATSALQTMGRGLTKIGEPFLDLFRKEGPANFLRKHHEKIIGKDKVAEVADALLNVKQLVPGSQPTAAEAVAGLPAGSPVQAAQKITAATEGGPSAEFGERLAKQKVAREIAARTRDILTRDMREEALSGANTAAQTLPKLIKTVDRAEKALKVKMPVDVAPDRLKSAVEIHAPYASPKLQTGAQMAGKDASREALDAAKQGIAQLETGGFTPLKSSSINQSIRATLSQPGIRASDVVQRTLSDVQEKIKTLSGKGGVIDARDLYTVRKEIGNTIQKNAKDTANWDKRMAAGLERDIQKHIDDAIEGAGGTGWKQYLKEYSTRTQAISDDIARAKLAGKPLQRTNLNQGVNVAREVAPALPSILSRPVVVGNWLLSHVGKQNIEPKIDKLAAELYLNPQELGKSLMPKPGMPSRNQAIIDALLQRAPIAGATVAGRQY